MTGTMIDLPGVIAESDGAVFLQEQIRDAAWRPMGIELSALCGTGRGAWRPERQDQRNGNRSALRLQPSGGSPYRAGRARGRLPHPPELARAVLPRLDAEWTGGCRTGAELWRRLRAAGFRGGLRVATEWAAARQ